MLEAPAARLAVARLTEADVTAAGYRHDPERPMEGYCLITGDERHCRVTIYIENGRTLTDRSHQGAFYYEGWILSDPYPVSVGVFNTGAGGEGSGTCIREAGLLGLDGATGVRVTAEPLGGSQWGALRLLQGRLIWLHGQPQPQPTALQEAEQTPQDGLAADATEEMLSFATLAEASREAVSLTGSALTEASSVEASQIEASPTETSPGGISFAEETLLEETLPDWAVPEALPSETAIVQPINAETAGPGAAPTDAVAFSAPGLGPAEAVLPAGEDELLPDEAAVPPDGWSQGLAEETPDSGQEPRPEMAPAAAAQPPAETPKFPADGIAGTESLPAAQPRAEAPPAPVGAAVRRITTTLSIQLESRHPMAPRAGGTAVLHLQEGRVTVTLRGLPSPAALGRMPGLDRPFNGYRLWLVNRRLGSRHPLSVLTRIWGENFRGEGGPGLPLSHFDTLLVTADDRTAGNPDPHWPQVMAGSFEPNPEA